MLRYIHTNSIIHKLNSTVKLVVLIALSIFIFTIKNYYILHVITIIGLILLILTKIQIKYYLKSILIIFCYILLTFVFNIIFSSLEYSLIISYRLFIMLLYTIIFSSTTKSSGIAKAVTNLLIPLKLFRINTKEIGIMVSIAINFIPVLTKEFKTIKQAQISKGYLPKFKNIKKYTMCILMPFITKSFKKVDEISMALYAKGHVD